MKKILTRIFALLLIVVFGAGIFSACNLFLLPDYDPDDGFDDPNDYVEPEYGFTVACSEDTTTITLSDIGYYGDVAELVYLKPYQYLFGEGNYGLAEDINATPVVIAEYECGTETTVEIDRYTDEDYDTVYCKFFVVQGTDILAGPIYATEIDPMYKHDEVIKTDTIKGVMCDDDYRTEVTDLGCQHTEINFVATGMIVPLERVAHEEDGNIQVTLFPYEEHYDEEGKLYLVNPTARWPYNLPQYVEEYWHNGKKYYFRTGDWDGHKNLDHYDELISQYTRDGVKVTLVILEALHLEQYIQPYFLTYEEARDSDYGSWFAVDTSNPYGAEYWAAFMEFLALRYCHEDSAEDAKYGAVETFVMGNEVDIPDLWHNMVNVNKHQKLNIEDYCLEYERMLRITNQSFKKVYARATALVSLDHYWATPHNEKAYAPKEMLDIISSKTAREGNYNWGLAIHPYGYDLGVPDFWRNDTNRGLNGSLNTRAITWTNLEVLQLYLEQRNKLFNGKAREVYVTEGGVSSSNSSSMMDDSKNQQAAGVAYAYYKCAQLSCIKAVNYYRLYDNLNEAAYFGLMTTTGVHKPAYDVYKYVDTQYSFDVSAPYLQYITWTRNENGTNMSYGQLIGNVHDWQDVMPITISQFDWDTHWNEDKIKTRIIDEILYF